MTTEIQMYTVENKEGEKLASWMRTHGLSSCGKVFFPAGVFMDEGVALMTASFDGEEIVTHNKHCYMKAEWIANIVDESMGQRILDAADRIRSMEHPD